MTGAAFHHLRRRLAAAGGRPAGRAAEAAAPRREVPEIRQATVVEPPLCHRAVGAPRPIGEPVAFLDGVQHTELLGYVGTSPVVAARIAAGVRRRELRRSVGSVSLRRQLVIARAPALEALGPLPAGSETVVLTDDEPPHPVGDHDRARAAVDAARTALEIAAARAFREREPATWLVADGTLTVSPDWSRDPRTVGVVKSHGTLPFDGDELECYLTVPAGQRTSVFAPSTRHVTPVHSWALRLWPWQGRDLFHGLVRVEAAAADDPGALADRVSRWLLAERAPLANDPRQDRLLYGIHDAERWLRARPA